MQAVARLFLQFADNRENASRKVAGSLAFSLFAAFFARDLHWPKAWCRLCEHQYDWLFRRQWTLHVAETWIFLPLHSPLNAHYWSLELANERSVCKMFAFTILSRKKVILTNSKDCWRLQFFLYIMHVYFRNSKRTLSFYLLFVSFCPTKIY